MEKYIQSYMREVKNIVDKIDLNAIENVIKVISNSRDLKGRLFILGLGGSAGNASHAVNDFRKIAGIESYAPTDNVSELTARINDDGWNSVLKNWLIGSNLNSNDTILVFSVGGGNLQKNVSVNLIEAMKFAKKVNAKIVGIIGRDGGYTSKIADACVIIPVVNSETITPHTESFQAVIWHLIVTHPILRVNKMKWESIE